MKALTIGSLFLFSTYAVFAALDCLNPMLMSLDSTCEPWQQASLIFITRIYIMNFHPIKKNIDDFQIINFCF